MRVAINNGGRVIIKEITSFIVRNDAWVVLLDGDWSHAMHVHIPNEQRRTTISKELLTQGYTNLTHACTERIPINRDNKKLYCTELQYGSACIRKCPVCGKITTNCSISACECGAPLSTKAVRVQYEQCPHCRDIASVNDINWERKKGKCNRCGCEFSLSQDTMEAIDENWNY